MGINDLLGIASRWVHIVSAMTVLGSVIFVRCGARGNTALFSGFRQAIVYVLAGIVASGVYNLLTKPQIPPGYHAAFGVKILLALHVAAVALIATKAEIDEGRRTRQLSGVMVSGFLLVLVSAYLRWLSR
jgi:hypothetical protein